MKILEYLNEKNEVVETNGDGQITANFGITEVGLNPGKKFKYKIKNTLKEMIELVAYSDDPDLHVTVEPKNLNGAGQDGSDGIMEVIFTPPDNRTSSLKGKWGAEVIIG